MSSQSLTLVTRQTDSRRFLAEEPHRLVHVRAPPTHPLLGVLQVDLLAVEGVVDGGEVAQLLLLLLQPAAQPGLRLLQLLHHLPALGQILEAQRDKHVKSLKYMYVYIGSWAQEPKLGVSHPVAVLQPPLEAVSDEQQFGLAGVLVGPALFGIAAVEDGPPSVHHRLTLPHQLLLLPQQAVETHLRERTRGFIFRE